MLQATLSKVGAVAVAVAVAVAKAGPPALSIAPSMP